MSEPFEISTLVGLDAVRDDLTEDYVLTADIDMWPTNPADHPYWTETDYDEEDRVLFEDGGITYIYECIQDTDDEQPPTDTDYWRQVHRALLPWSAGEYAEGSWVKHGSDPELTYYANATTSGEPGDSVDWDEMWESAEGWEPIGYADTTPFTGTFDGGHHTLSNLHVDRTATRDWGHGLFGWITGTVSNLHLKDISVTGDQRYAGGLTGALDSGTVSDCSVIGGTVTGVDRVGGLTGHMVNGLVERCVTDVKMTLSGEGGGGIAGRSWSDAGQTQQIVDCCARGAFTAGGLWRGGVLGQARANDGFVTRCYACVPGTDTVGGLVRLSSGSTTVVDSFWDTDVGVGISNGGVGKGTAEMQDIDTYTDRLTDGLGVLLDDGGASGTATENTITTTEDLSGDLAAEDEIKITDGTNTEIHEVVSVTADTITIDGTLANSYSDADIFDVTDSGYDMVLKSEHTGDFADGVWYIDDGEDYPRLWFEYPVAVEDEPEGAGTVGASGSLEGAGSTDPAGAGSVSATGSLEGVGSATHSGAGTVSATGSLEGVGTAPGLGGSGTVSATGSLEGAGAADYAGAGAVAGTGSLAGTGHTTHSGYGEIGAVGSLEGTGETPTTGGAGAVSAAGSLEGAGYSQPIGAGDVVATAEILGAGYIAVIGYGSITANGTLVGAGEGAIPLPELLEIIHVDSTQLIWEFLTEPGTKLHELVGNRVWSPRAPEGWRNDSPAVIFDVTEMSHPSGAAHFVMVFCNCYGGTWRHENADEVYRALHDRMHRGAGVFPAGELLCSFLDNSSIGEKEVETGWPFASARFRAAVK